VIVIAEPAADELWPAAGALAAGVVLLVLLLPHAAASSVVPSSTPSFTGSGARVSIEMLILSSPVWGGTARTSTALVQLLSW
jgi:hypothetical protein